ncbi:S-layer homology domain-containing protein [Cohnella rhizosphaerae]|uniref:S-layer homology domain-containing protein n=1 Tax=Cohnella rhizosphaerae TaxID=1457232 RepID=A0A9X4KZC1_9BACL|nr:S-layer homology domain-containing protein [Cohnella rhizosphaerae]MDG0810532.1 S-layer homology domain-containing protein [Cohnella rhizosphaerae]
MDSESHDARLKGIAVDGSSLAGFDSGKTSYDLQLPAGTTAVPAVTAASMHQNAEVTVTQAESTTGKAVIQVTAEDGITKSVYEIRFSVASIVNPQQPGSGTGTNQGTDPGKVPDPDKDPDTKPDDSGVKVTLSDVPVGHWAADSIRKAAGLGIITGYKDGTFKPDREVSRAEFIAMLARALKLPTDGASAVTFADAGSIASWAQPYVAQAAQNGLITGFADGTFRPLATINRAELSALLVRASGLQVPSDVEASSLSFNDVDQIPKWAVRYAAIAVDKGLLQGVSGNRFDATGIVTRAQAAVAIMRLLNE